VCVCVGLQSEVSASDYATLQDKLELEEAIKLSLESALDKRTYELVLAHDELHRKTAELRECQQKLADSEADSMLLRFQVRSLAGCLHKTLFFK
jgi:hypothetical protein